MQSANANIGKIISDSAWERIYMSNTPVSQIIFRESFFNFREIAIVTNVGTGIGAILPGYTNISINTISRNAATEWSYTGNFQFEIYGSSMEAINLTFAKYYKTHEPAFVAQGEIYHVYIRK